MGVFTLSTYRSNEYGLLVARVNPMTNLEERLQNEKATLITRIVELEQALAHERGLREAAESGLRAINRSFDQECQLREAAEAERDAWRMGQRNDYDEGETLGVTP